MRITDITRRDIRDLFATEHINWSGRLQETDFLARLYDIDNLPSQDGRFSTARGDIQQHRINNFDWDDDWIFYDGRIGLMKADDDSFLRFLCETLHPAIRPDKQETQRLLGLYNQILLNDGFKIVEKERRSGRPVYVGNFVGLLPNPDVDAIRKKLPVANDDYVTQQIRRMQDSIESDPELAIGTAKELIETVCRTILEARGESFDGTADLPQLVKKTSKLLKLTPSDIPETAKASEIIKRLLSNLASIPQGIAELRNPFGTGHGKVAGTKGLLPRHARLAVGTASALAVFLLETHSEKPL
jgi:hypothetical protein